jgi:hypothetical protein
MSQNGWWIAGALSRSAQTFRKRLRLSTAACGHGSVEPPAIAGLNNLSMVDFGTDSYFQVSLKTTGLTGGQRVARRQNGWWIAGALSRSARTFRKRLRLSTAPLKNECEGSGNDRSRWSRLYCKINCFSEPRPAGVVS